MDKPKVGFFSLSSCGGCILEVLRKPETLIDLSEKIDIVAFRTIRTDIPNAALDFAVIEGSIGSLEDRARSEEIRSISKRVIALGACADTGGVQARQGSIPLYEVIHVDNIVRGCPIDADEFVHILVSLMIGRLQDLRETSVCMECRQKSVRCIMEDGGACMGPSTLSGCKAVCPSNRTWCLGCRSETADSNRQQMDLLLRGRISIWGFFGSKDGKH